MKKTLFFMLLIISIITACNRDKPSLFDEEAKLKIENTSESNNITGVYFGTVGSGETNRISSNIAPGESKIFTIDIGDDNVYDIKVTSDMTGYEEFVANHHSFYWNDTYVIELTNNGWYEDD